MSTISDELKGDLTTWFGDRPVWLQIAAAMLLDGNEVTDAKIKEFARLALDEALEDLKTQAPPIDLAALGAANAVAVRLKSISAVQGIGNLSPRRPLSFGDAPITVVYGSNGAGKSSYVRILKHACGARNKGNLHPDVFNGAAVHQACKIGYQEGGTDKELNWTPAVGVAPELAAIDIFDTHCGDSYLFKEGEPSYEPRVLAFLSDLASLCERVSTLLDAEIQKRASALPRLPQEHTDAEAGKWYAALTARTTKAQIDGRTAWADATETEWSEIEKYFAEQSPNERSAELRKKNDLALALGETLSTLSVSYSDEAFESIELQRKDVREKQAAAELAAKLDLQEAILHGVGSESWMALWKIARTYSTEQAYPGHEFPHVGDESRCVLCQQVLADDGKRRLTAFENFVTAEASNAAKAAKNTLTTNLESLPDIQKELLLTKAVQAGLSAVSLQQLDGLLVALNTRRAKLLSDTFPDSGFGDPLLIDTIAATLHSLADAHEAKAKEFLDGFSPEERALKLARRKELAAIKWVGQQKTAIETEVSRLERVEILEKAKRLCLTTAISRRKGALSEELLTPAYIAAFNRELKNLGARKIRVELAKTRVERGHILHQVKLRGATQAKPIHDILSEGEHRIVCIAAFLADVSGKPNGSTFVFDDPISSLDLDFEEAVVQRLVALSTERQLVIFTHRLSLLGMVQDYAKKAEIDTNVIHVRREPWGAGEPGDESIECAKPKACLNNHLPARIREARRVLEADGETPYRIHAQQICSEIRKLIERMIESELLADVVQRHRRAINTQGKIDKLPDITANDCKLVEDMMTKYSRYEHSQSSEAPVALPEPDELDEDIAALKTWRDGIEQRRR